MNADQRLAAIRATWWAGPAPNAFLISRDDAPLGVIHIPAHLLGLNQPRLFMPCIEDSGAVFASHLFGKEFPGEMPLVDRTRKVEVEQVWRRPLFWRVCGRYDDATLATVQGFWPVLEPLPDYLFLAALDSAYTWYCFGKAIRDHFSPRMRGGAQ